MNKQSDTPQPAGAEGAPVETSGNCSQEFVKLWKVNDHMAAAKCTPNAMGCNASAWRPLIPCLQDLSVDHVLAAAETGTLSIQGSINKLVDECPYQGFLLNGVATVTCMVRPKMAARSFLAAPNAQYGGAVEGARVGSWEFDDGYLGSGGPGGPGGPGGAGGPGGPGGPGRGPYYGTGYYGRRGNGPPSAGLGYGQNAESASNIWGYGLKLGDCWVFGVTKAFCNFR
eukprot:Skav224277  [mRNA]  locus=scaffold217:115808:124284:+ [translate_table: standard]